MKTSRCLKVLFATCAVVASALGLLIVAAELSDETFSVFVGDHQVGVGPWLRYRLPLFQDATGEALLAGGECITVTHKRRAWLVWTH